MNAVNRERCLALNPLHVASEDHDFLMDAAGEREGLDYELVVPHVDSSDDDASVDEDD